MEGVKDRRSKLSRVAALSAVALGMVGLTPANAGDTYDWRVRTNDGGTMPAKDFRKGRGVVPTDYTPRDYSYSYPNADSPEYSIFLNSGIDDSFTVTIDQEPVGPNRRKAADKLAGMLGVSLKDLCNLLGTVGAPYYASPKYAGRELGFPGCPGSVRFPGDPQF